MQQAGKTAGTKRVLSACAMATVWLAWVEGGLAADAPAPGVELRGAPSVSLCPNANSQADCNNPAHWDGDTLYVFTSHHAPSRNSGQALGSLTNRSPSVQEKPWGTAWLEATWKDTNGMLYDCYHNEDQRSAEGPRMVIPRIGKEISTNNGATWKNLGLILEAPRYSSNTNTVNTYIETYVIILNRAVTPAWGNEGHYITFNRDLSNPAGWTVPRKFSNKGHWYGQVIGIEQGKRTDKLAGRVARFFVHGSSGNEIVFKRQGEK